MNTRSLRFQLTVWYAGLLSGCFVLLGATAYFLLKGYLEGDLRDSQLRRARQISLLIQEELRRGSEIRLGEEIEARFAPSLNNRCNLSVRTAPRPLLRPLDNPGVETVRTFGELPRRRVAGTAADTSGQHGLPTTGRHAVFD